MSLDVNISAPDAVTVTAPVPVVPSRVVAIASELSMVLVWTVAADLLIYRGRGYFAIAVLFAVALVAVAVAHWFRERPSVGTMPATARIAVIIAGSLLVLAVLRLGWEGSVSLSFAAAFVFVAWVLALSGWLPTLSRILTAIFLSPFWGAERLPQLQGVSISSRVSASGSAWMSVLFPVVAVGLFGGIFILANPDWVERVSSWISRAAGRFVDFFSQVSFWELPFCILAFFVGAGLLRPLVPGAGDLINRIFGEDAPDKIEPMRVATADGTHAMYTPFRNMLIALIGLFAVYLVFEFTTLWRREFPAGFYYAGYAHEGAAWLTVALGLATFTLSLVFHDAMFRDPRIERLKTLAWIWSAMNLLLALAVYNRLSIYVGYNGMTRMRMIGFFGITLVVVGFSLVIFKILRRHSLQWLIQSQLIAFSLAVVLYCLFPVDFIAHQYNASQVSGGYLEPAVMIAVKPIDDEGVFPLLSLADHPDEIIRDGVCAMLADRQRQIETYSRDTPWTWHRYQYSKTLLYRKLVDDESKWMRYLRDSASSELAIKRFQDYAMQWY